jgi:hypothetical protein
MVYRDREEIDQSGYSGMQQLQYGWYGSHVEYAEVCQNTYK